MEAIKLAPATVMTMDAVVFHIIGRTDWAKANEKGSYEPDRFAVEGFIHLSQRAQILQPANLLYRGRSDLILLVIQADRLLANLVYEPGSHGEAELFPHLYGALNLDAVNDTIDFPCEPDGSFVLPEVLRA